MSAPLDAETLYRIGWLVTVLEAVGPLTLSELDTRTSGLRLMDSDALARVVKLAVERGYIMKSGETYTKS